MQASRPNAVPTLVVGEALIDIVHDTSGGISEHIGGSPLNVAIGLGRLGHPVTLATSIGSDPHGASIELAVLTEGVELTADSVNQAHTSTATATLDATGAATYEFDLTWAPAAPPASIDGHLHTGSIATALQPGASAVRDAVVAHRSHGTTSLDPNLRPTIIGTAASVRSDIEELVGLSDVVKASDEDIAWLYGDEGGTTVDVALILKLWAQLGPSLVVATLGGDGALAYLSSTDEMVRVPGRTVELIDTVGAGDSFMSGMISSLLDAGLLGNVEARERLRAADRSSLLAAVEHGIATSAITVSRAGSNPPTRDDVVSAGSGPH